MEALINESVRKNYRNIKRTRAKGMILGNDENNCNFYEENSTQEIQKVYIGIDRKYYKNHVTFLIKKNSLNK